jgi:hypothetical protein
MGERQDCRAAEQKDLKTLEGIGGRPPDQAARIVAGRFDRGGGCLVCLSARA